jgi:ComF family protein
MYFSSILDIIFPKKCLSCHKEGFYVCPDCLAKIPLQKGVRCYVCGKRAPDGKTCPSCKTKIGSSLTGLAIASDWNNLLVRQMIYEFKYRFIKDISQSLGNILINFIELNRIMNFQILIPVPLHKRRVSWRGFNQAQLLADQLNKHLGIPIINNLLIRKRHTSPQMEIKDRGQRIKNVSGAFEINSKSEINSRVKNLIINKSVLIIDDVCTTASTFENCAAVLKPLMPKQIWGLAVARG